MDIKFTLTPQQISTIQRAAQQRFEAADKAFRQAREEYNASLALRSTTQYGLDELSRILAAVGANASATANVVLNVPEPKPDTHRPRNVITRYSFGSKSGEGEGHEVVIGYNEDSRVTVTSCNCVAGTHKRDCWAQKAVKDVHRVFGSQMPPRIQKYGQPDGNRQHFANAEFGLPR